MGGSRSKRRILILFVVFEKKKKTGFALGFPSFSSLVVREFIRNSCLQAIVEDLRAELFSSLTQVHLVYKKTVDSGPYELTTPE